MTEYENCMTYLQIITGKSVMITNFIREYVFNVQNIYVARTILKAKKIYYKSL